MNGRWRFQIVGVDRKGTYIARDGQMLELLGGDEEALAQAWQLMKPVADEGQRVQAVSVGCPSGLSITPGRLLVLVEARADGRGWNLNGDMMHGSWHRSLVDAVSYGAFRTTGYTSETWIVNVRGAVTHVVLIPGDGKRKTLY